MKILNPFALLNNQLVNINHPDIKSGINENCICPDPNCKEPLFARKGKIKVHHFAHKSSNNCNGFETAIHLKSKEIISNLDKLSLPRYCCFPGNIFNNLKDEILEIEKKYKYPLYSDSFINEIIWTSFDFNDFMLFSNKTLDLKDYIIESEVFMNGMVPDIKLINRKNKKILYIEIAITSFIKEKKRDLIREKDLTLIEFDLSKYYKSEYYFPQNSNDFETYLTTLFSGNYSIDSDDYYKFRLSSNRWININKENELINGKRKIYVKIFQNKLSKYYEFYNKYFIKVLRDYHNVLDLMSSKQLLNSTYFDEYDDFKRFITPKMVEHFKNQYFLSDIALFKEQEKKINEKKTESVQDFIKRMTS